MLGRWAGFDMEWVEANVYDAVEALGGQTFDVVYTGVGAINWLPNLDRWAEVVADLVEPGGIFYLYEVHPWRWRWTSREPPSSKISSAGR